MPWASLDGASWLYYVTAGTTPFEVVEKIYTNDCGLTTSSFEQGNLLIYPNPASGKLFIAPISEVVTVRTYDISGKLIYTRQLNGAEQTNEVDISTLCPGLYYLVISTLNNSITRRCLLRVG
jgi:hypothetical protein